MKGSFVSHLYEALKWAGLNPFLDKRCLVTGGHALGSIDAALEGARVHVAVVSGGYADSKYCLTELVAMLRSGKPVIPVFYDVEPCCRWRMGCLERPLRSTSPGRQLGKWRSGQTLLGSWRTSPKQLCNYNG